MVSEYLRRARDGGVSWVLAQQLSDAELDAKTKHPRQLVCGTHRTTERTRYDAPRV